MVIVSSPSTWATNKCLHSPDLGNSEFQESFQFPCSVLFLLEGANGSVLSKHSDKKNTGHDMTDP